MKILLILVLLAPTSGSQALAQPLSPRALWPIEGLFESAKYDEVIRHLEGPGVQKIRRRDRARAFELLGASYERVGKIDEALGIYQLAEGLYPDDIRILLPLANLLHRIALDERARPRYERVLHVQPNNAEANKGLAEIYHSQGLLQKAEQHYEVALIDLDKHPWTWRDYAEVLAERRNFRQAIQAIHKSLELASDVNSLLDLALFERRRGRHIEALRVIEEALSKAPGRTDLVLQRSLWHLEDGDLSNALQGSMEVLTHFSDHPLARWIKASIELRQGQFDLAAKDLKVAAQGDRSHPFIAQVAQTMLEQLVVKR